MKYVTLKVVDVKTGDSTIDDDPKKAQTFKYREWLLWAISVNTNQEGGMDAAEMKRRLRVLDIIEPAKDGDTVALEDADHEKLKNLIDRPIWGIFTRHHLDFLEHIREAPALALLKTDKE